MQQVKKWLGDFVDAIYSPSRLTEIIRATLQTRLPFVWIRGEIGNFSHAASGHIYFVLKDANAQINCVWFAGKQTDGGQKFDPLTGEVFEKPRPPAWQLIENGIEVLCAGAITIYPPRGQYQLNVEIVQPAGIGLLAQEFEMRKQRFAVAGYFAAEHKRPLPVHPLHVALVASPDGAAIHDFLKISRDRGLSSHVRLFPSPAQGAGAAELMARTIKFINEQNWADVIVLIRGGGSLEDLWAYNEDELVNAIHQSGIPVLAGIGHEIDVTLADMTADVRAATPTHAAQLLWPSRNELWQRLDNLHMALSRHTENIIDALRSKITALDDARQWLSPAMRIDRLETALKAAEKRLQSQTDYWINSLEQSYNLIESKRCSARQPEMMMHKYAYILQESTGALLSKMRQRLADSSNALARNEMSLEQLNPAAPLQRGYAIVLDNKGIRRTVKDIARNEQLKVVLSDGFLAVRLENASKSSFADPADILRLITSQKDH